ncbi:ribonuclease J [Marinivivus vitaminiproducens]|uniref:ribonuclease J n=1 Tax=Marinivivus vitaminiproducens TaxID=3035935 RepID=UPI00279FBE08|nr:ribonuclease J [Geminicoccaceae bacterium SCSIO 64248]
MTDDGLLLVPLGGTGEIGLNVMLYGLNGRWLMVDCGITFADETLPGVEIVLPDLRFIEANASKLDGLVLTHAHEDHYGAVAYVWERLGCPVWCTPFTAAMLRNKLQETRLLGRVPINVVEPGQPFSVGPFDCSLVHMTHSIAESSALVLDTPFGKVVHSGDWKLDPEPLVGEPTDIATLERLGDGGVLALVSDSTNIFNPGTSGSEAEVRASLTELIAKQPDRVVVTTFASNVARIESVMLAAEAAGREIVLAGRSMHRVVAAAKEAGYLKTMPEVMPERHAADLPRDRVVILSTGCQGEARAAMARMANGSHPHLRLDPGDTVIFSSKIIPGNERILYNLHNQLVRGGVEVITEQDHFVHVSGHPCRDEVGQLYRWLRPQIAIPVHGESRHLHEHRRFATELGIKRTVELANGDMVRIAPGEPEHVDDVPVGRIAVDATAGQVDTGADVFRERRRLMHNGTIFVSLVMDDVGSLIADPQITAIGSIRLADEGARTTLVEAIVDAIEDLADWQAAEDGRVIEAVRGGVRRGLELGRDKRPLIEVQVTRLNAETLSALEGAAS